MRSIGPVKYYSDEGFVDHKIELGDEDLEEILRADLERHADFDFDEVEVVKPHEHLALCQFRKYVDLDVPAAEQEAEASQLGAEVKVTGNMTATRREGNGDRARARPVGPVLTETRNCMSLKPLGFRKVQVRDSMSK